MSKKGLEPSRNYPHEPESCASTNSATSTFKLFNYYSSSAVAELDIFYTAHLVFTRIRLLHPGLDI